NNDVILSLLGQRAEQRKDLAVEWMVRGCDLKELALWVMPVCSLLVRVQSSTSATGPACRTTVPEPRRDAPCETSDPGGVGHVRPLWHTPGVNYHDSKARLHTYDCVLRHNCYEESRCQHVAGPCLDAFVCQQILAALEPAALEQVSDRVQAPLEGLPPGAGKGSCQKVPGARSAHEGAHTLSL
ncbi:MAG TPA: hypothetical protein VH599_17855, partial [Ktedonobacterales bacterium]